MDLLGVGVPELIVIIVLALIFVGPRDLPKLAVRAAEFLRDIRKMSEGLTSEWQKEINSADLDLGGIKELSNELSEAQKSIKKMTSLKIDLDTVTNPATPAETPAPPSGETPPPPTAEPLPPANTTPPPEETSTRDQPDE